MSNLACRRFRNLIEPPTRQVAQRVASQCVASEQNRIDDQHQSADADTEFPVKPHRSPGI